MTDLTTDILIVGGGAAGIAAAAASAEKASITIVDDNPFLGGQVWRASSGTISSPAAKQLIKKINGERVQIINGAYVYGVDGDGRLLADSPRGRLSLTYQKLIIATGARELLLPFPGWTLPGVFGAGGLQAMVKGGARINGKTVVIVGTGPLLIAVADHLKSKGARVLAIAEQASRSRINRFAFGLWRYPGKIAQAAALKARIRDIRYLTGCWVTSASGDEKVEEVTLYRRGKSWSVSCDYLAYGYHLVPNLELPALMGCAIDNGFASIDEFQQTSVKNVFCAGEPTGIGGVEASLVEGRIAGLAATGRAAEARSLFAKRDRTRRFAALIDSTFELRDELKALSTDQTIVCRCEDVEFERLAEFTSFRDAKLQTRCGMGPCQGRICGAATRFIFGWEPPSVRPPIFPVRMEDL